MAALARAMESVATDPALRDELRDRGLKRVEQFRWEQTARATVDVYRSAVFRPSQRSLQARRLLARRDHSLVGTSCRRGMAGIAMMIQICL